MLSDWESLTVDFKSEQPPPPQSYDGKASSSERCNTWPIARRTRWQKTIITAKYRANAIGGAMPDYSQSTSTKVNLFIRRAVPDESFIVDVPCDISSRKQDAST